MPMEPTLLLGISLLCLFLYLLCYAPVLKFSTYYAQYYAHACMRKRFVLKFDCFIRINSLDFNVVTVLFKVLRTTQSHK